MIVTLLSEKSMNALSLPEKIKGQYWITEEEETGEKINLMEIEGVNGCWRLKSNQLACLLSEEGEACKYHELQIYDICRVALLKDGRSVYIMTEPDTEDRRIYTKYRVRYAEVELNIGRGEENDIIYKENSVSHINTSLRYKDGQWEVTDEDSTNGTYCNNQRIYGTQELAFGDMLYIMGLKIVLGKGFLAINNPDQKVSVNYNLLIEQENPSIEMMDEDDIEILPIEYYYRSPRFRRDIEEKKISVDAPPATFKREEMPLLMVLGPSVTMGIASLTMAAFSIYNAAKNGNVLSSIPSMVMSLSMLLGTVLWPIMSKKYEKKRNAEKEEIRINKYSSYLADIKKQIEKEIGRQRAIIEENNQDANYWTKIIKEKSHKLWERSIRQEDFLNIRIGLGEMDAQIKFIYQERKFTMDEDDLHDQMFSICENKPKLTNVPICVSLVKDNIFGVVGNESNVYEFLNGILVQLIGAYGYDELKLVFFLNEGQEREFGFIRRLPHVWTNDGKMRMIATNYSETKEVSSYLEMELERRRENHREDISNMVPYYIIFVLDKKVSERAEVLKKIYKDRNNINMSVICIGELLRKLPKECMKIIELEGSRAYVYDRNDITGRRVPIAPDYYMGRDMDDIASCLASTQLDLSEEAFNLPKMITFLEMYGVGKVEYLNAEVRWSENNPVKSLEAPIGIDTMGELFKLDLHEKFHGPHGLVAGMTGSGKSEFIMTLILSLALNYHPNEVAFVLIDYKGGGMAKAFEKLPHTAGIITNLDGAAVKRSLVSIQSELKRRQSVFSEAGKAVGESNIDIYTYQKLYREGKVQKPLPHLFIISDEFAELKTQQPEFMEQLISAARIGRSLGIHLILATQKPAGVVDDQIWSNSKFRICLKVQDRADSMDMLKRPDAAELSDTGRFYLQVGYNELFELGQSAWAGAAYVPSERVEKKRDTSVELLDRCGNALFNQKIEKQHVVQSPKKQLDEITEYLAKVALEENISIQRLWLEPISDRIYVENLRRKYSHKEELYKLNPIIGEYDDPMRQRQCLLTLPLSTEGNAIIYGTAGNGKTTFLTTMLYSLISTHTPEELKIYVLDFSSETLRAFSKVPHVGDVLVSGDDEKLENMFKLLEREIVKRKQICSEYGGDYDSYITSGKTDMPNIVVAINNYAGFSETYEEFEEYVQYQSREGIKYGIYFVITALSTNAIRYRLQQNFKQMFVMQMNDEGEYSSVLGSTGGMVPSKYKGRGLFKTDMIYEFQTAYVDKPERVFDCIRNYALRLVEYYGERSSEIPILPGCITTDTFKEKVILNKIPIGIAKESVQTQYINMIDNPVAIMTGNNVRDIEQILMGVIEEFIELDDVEITLIDGSKRILEDEVGCSLVQDDFEETIVDIFQTILHRNNYYKECHGVLPEGEEFDEKIIILHNFADIRQELSDDAIDKIKVAMDKNTPDYHVRFLISDTVDNLYRYSREAWYRHYNSDNGGIYVGNGIADQFTITVNGSNAELKLAVEQNFGYLVRNGEAILTKFVVSRREAENE